MITLAMVLRMTQGCGIVIEGDDGDTVLFPGLPPIIDGEVVLLPGLPAATMAAENVMQSIFLQKGGCPNVEVVQGCNSIDISHSLNLFQNRSQLMFVSSLNWLCPSIEFVSELCPRTCPRFRPRF